MLTKIEHKCTACGEPCYAWADPCMPCVRARHKGVFTHKCTCPKRLKRPRSCSNGMGREWIACDRCLQTIRQVS